MKVLLLNGSRREKGCTYTALSEIAQTLEKQGIQAEIIHAVPETEIIKSVAEKVKTADGLVVGSPVYWASPSGEIISFMDRLSSLAGKDLLHKPAAAVASARRAGTTATLDVLAKYFTYHQMPVVSANYWNVVHGNTPDEVKKDAVDLKPALELVSHISFVKDVEKGTSISYSGTFVAPKEMRIATIPVGYGDGYPRSLSNKGYVLIHGKRADIVGRVCMDQFMVDVTEIPEAKFMDPVTLVGKDKDAVIRVEDLSDLSGRFNYEFVCDLSKRVPREYYKNGTIVKQIDYFE